MPLMTSHNILVMSEAGSSPLLQGIICLFSLNKNIKKSGFFLLETHIGTDIDIEVIMSDLILSHESCE